MEVLKGKIETRYNTYEKECTIFVVHVEASANFVLIYFSIVHCVHSVIYFVFNQMQIFSL